MPDEPKKKCFVIAPIGEEGSAHREHSDTVLNYIINPVLDALGFEPGDRADKLGKPGIITTQILERIAKDDLVIADLTDHNPNVFYELAIRHGMRKPFIQMIKGDQKIPFDVGQQRTIKFDATTLKGGELAKTELTAQVKACFAEGFEMETPLGRAFDFQALQAGGAVERTLNVIVEKLDGLARRHAYDKHVRFQERMVADAHRVALSEHPAIGLKKPISSSAFLAVPHETFGGQLLRAWFPDYSPEKAREFTEALNVGLARLGENLRAWTAVSADIQASKTADEEREALGFNTEGSIDDDGGPSSDDEIPEPVR
jgi:hypothetical protein